MTIASTAVAANEKKGSVANIPVVFDTDITDITDIEGTVDLLAELAGFGSSFAVLENLIAMSFNMKLIIEIFNTTDGGSLDCNLDNIQWSYKKSTPDGAGDWFTMQTFGATTYQWTGADATFVIPLTNPGPARYFRMNATNNDTLNGSNNFDMKAWIVAPVVKAVL